MLIISAHWSGFFAASDHLHLPMRMDKGEIMSEWEAIGEFPEAKKAVRDLVAIRKEEIADISRSETRIRTIVARTCSHSSPKKEICDLVLGAFVFHPRQRLLADLRRLERTLAIMEGGRSKGSERDIAKAKEVPISSFIEFGKDGKATSIFAPSERTPSMHYYERSNRIHCFATGRTEDSIGAMMEMRRCGFMEAVGILCEMA